MARKTVNAKRKKANKPSSAKKARPQQRKTGFDEDAQIHQNIHPVEPSVDLKRR